MMVTDSRCWWQNHHIDNFFRYVRDVFNVLNRSPRSQNCHQHIWSPTSVTNINVTKNFGDLFKPKRLRPLSYNQTDVFILCFSIVNPSSFDAISDKWVPEIQHHRPGTPFILVGTQMDLRDDKEKLAEMTKIKLKPITVEKGKVLARQIGAAQYLECSSLTQKGSLSLSSVER